METARLRLDVLTPERIPDLFATLGSEPDIYRWLNFARPETLEEFTKVMNNLIAETAAGLRIAHVVIEKSTNKAIGTTSLMDLKTSPHALEIGSTFYAKEYWRSFVNTECKLMMLTEAFESRGVERVYFKTDSLNERSRNAILRIGARFEGILRHHMKRPDGTWRDSAYFSILKEEWPSVKENLIHKISRY